MTPEALIKVMDYFFGQLLLFVLVILIFKGIFGIK